MEYEVYNNVTDTVIATFLYDFDAEAFIATLKRQSRYGDQLLMRKITLAARR